MLPKSTSTRRLSAVHFRLLMDVPSVIFDRGGVYESITGTPTELQLLDLSAAGFLAVERVEPSCLDLVVTDLGWKLLERLWDYNLRRYQRSGSQLDAERSAAELSHLPAVPPMKRIDEWMAEFVTSSTSVKTPDEAKTYRADFRPQSNSQHRLDMSGC